MFVAFINKHPKIYSLKIDTWIWEEIEFNDGLYDFKWVTAPINGEYPMKAINKNVTKNSAIKSILPLL